jgi:hypothetical protein
MPNGLVGMIGLGNFCGIWFNLIFKYCYFNNRNKIKLCCFPWKIQTNLYPLIFGLFIMLLTFEIKIDVFIGMGLGLI